MKTTLTILVAALCLTACERDDSDAADGTRSGITPLTDALTGCQYLARSYSITPRLAADGTHIVGCKRT